MVDETLPPGLPAVTAATAMSLVSLALQQALALGKEQQEEMRRLTEKLPEIKPNSRLLWGIRKKN